VKSNKLTLSCYFFKRRL